MHIKCFGGTDILLISLNQSAALSHHGRFFSSAIGNTLTNKYMLNSNYNPLHRLDISQLRRPTAFRLTSFRLAAKSVKRYLTRGFIPQPSTSMEDQHHCGR